VPRGTALMSVERVAQSVAGLPVEFARDVYRADRVRLMVRTDVRTRQDRQFGDGRAQAAPTITG
jgi:GntR family transcriptional regulator